jgi:carbonic anhydrase
MRKTLFATLALAYGLASCAADRASNAPVSQAAAAGHAEHPGGASPGDALEMLSKGNQRYVSGHLQHPHQSPDRRTELANTQVPSAVIIGCSDSRTSPELVFDQGLGDLFVIRVAGNVVDDHALGSVEYAAEHLGTKLIVVLGHERCGAVKAARESASAKSESHDHIASLVASIRPAVDATVGADADATCRANVHNVEQALRTSEPVLKAMVDAGRVRVVGAYYDLDTGVVTFLDN